MNRHVKALILMLSITGLVTACYFVPWVAMAIGVTILLFLFYLTCLVMVDGSDDPQWR